MDHHVTIWIALFAGIASFISPCCLPLYPSYLSYMTGISVSTLRAGQNHGEARLRTLAHAFAFCLGFSVVFFTLGWGVGQLTTAFMEYKDLIRKLSALILLLMGLFMMGIFKPQFLMKEWKWQMSTKPAGYLGSFLIGIGFAAGWSPCVGSTLSSILALSLSEKGAWLPLITAYSIGFALPFLILAFFIGSARKLLRYSEAVMKIGGVVMVLIAFLLYTDRMARITIWFNAHTPNWLQF